MRENRPYGLEGGGAGQPALPTLSCAARGINDVREVPIKARYSGQKAGAITRTEQRLAGGILRTVSLAH